MHWKDMASSLAGAALLIMPFVLFLSDSTPDYRSYTPRFPDMEPQSAYEHKLSEKAS